MRDESAEALTCLNAFSDSSLIPHPLFFFRRPDPFARRAVTTDGSKFAKTETSTSGFA
jgi:hypothetical protein